MKRLGSGKTVFRTVSTFPLASETMSEGGTAILDAHPLTVAIVLAFLIVILASDRLTDNARSLLTGLRRRRSGGGEPDRNGTGDGEVPAGTGLARRRRRRLHHRLVTALRPGRWVASPETSEYQESPD